MSFIKFMLFICVRDSSFSNLASKQIPGIAILGIYSRTSSLQPPAFNAVLLIIISWWSMTVIFIALEND